MRLCMRTGGVLLNGHSCQLCVLVWDIACEVLAGAPCVFCGWFWVTGHCVMCLCVSVSAGAQLRMAKPDPDGRKALYKAGRRTTC